MNNQPRKTKQISLFVPVICVLMSGFYACKSTVATIEPVKEESLVEESTIETYVETIPIANKSFDMVLVPEGQFLMGSPSDEPNRKDDEGPQKKVSLSERTESTFW